MGKEDAKQNLIHGTINFFLCQSDEQAKTLFKKLNWNEKQSDGPRIFISCWSLDWSFDDRTIPNTTSCC